MRVHQLEDRRPVTLGDGVEQRAAQVVGAHPLQHGASDGKNKTASYLVGFGTASGVGTMYGFAEKDIGGDSASLAGADALGAAVVIAEGTGAGDADEREGNTGCSVGAVAVVGAIGGSPSEGAGFAFARA